MTESQLTAIIIFSLIPLTAIALLVYVIYDPGQAGAKNKLDSMPEKQASNKENNCVEHWMYVSELRDLLKKFKDDDWVTPNQVGNLNIGRSDDSQVATINFAFNEIEWWRE